RTAAQGRAHRRAPARPRAALRQRRQKRHPTRNRDRRTAQVQKRNGRSRQQRAIVAARHRKHAAQRSERHGPRSPAGRLGQPGRRTGRARPASGRSAAGRASSRSPRRAGTARRPTENRCHPVTQDAKPDELDQEQPQETFISHLVELRSRLMKAAVAVLGIFVVLFIYPGASVIYDVLAQPMLASLPEGTRMIATGVITPFMVPVKVTLMAAFVVALPVVLYQAWAFVAPGLYRHEKRLALPLIVSSTLLFILGMAFCYFFVFRTVFHFIATFAPQSITPAPDIEAYLSFVMTMFMAFGITFEVPV